MAAGGSGQEETAAQPEAWRGARRLRDAALGLLIALSAAPAAAQGTAAATPCAQGLVVPGGGGPAGRFVLCSEVERQVPQLRQQLEKLAAGQAAGDERLRDMERLLRNLNAAAARIEARQIELARSLAQKLAEASAQGEASAGRQVRRLGDDLEEVNEKATRAAANRAQAEAAAALKAAIDDAVAKLDFAKANRLLDSIEALQRQLTGVEKKIDTVVETTDDSRNATLFAEALRSKARGDLGQVRALSVFVRQGRTFDRQDLSGVGFPALQAPGLRAPGAELTLAAFQDADLTGADLTQARMVATVLERTKLARAKLTRARAALAQAARADLQGADLGLSSWTAADLRGADLRQASLKGASLQHADLSGADLRGADLSGAFLGNADLREAKLEGAVFANTDVSGALLPRNLLTPAQAGGLCATPAPARSGQGWSVVESIPSSRFTGGYEHRRIFDARLFLGSGGHRPYPRCAPRPKGTIADWNAPVYGDGGEFWSDGFSFGVEHPLMQAVGRRGELLSRIEAARAAAEIRWKELPTLPQFAEIRRRLHAALDERQRSLGERLLPAGPLMFDGDTATLVAMRLRPAVLAEVGIDWPAASHGGFGDFMGQAKGQPKPWPRLFPEGLQQDDLSDVTTRAWERWVQARSRAMRNNEVRLSATRELFHGAPWSRVVTHGSRYGTEEPLLARRLGVEVGRLVTYRQVHSLAAAKRAVDTGFLIEGDLDAVRAALQAAGTPRDAEPLLTANVKDVRLVPADGIGSELLLWTLEILPR